LGVGVLGPNPKSPIPNPQSPFPNPQLVKIKTNIKFKKNDFKILNIKI